MVSTIHRELSPCRIPITIFLQNSRFFSKKALIYLHGGPFYSIKNFNDDQIIPILFKTNRDIYAINYCGSIGFLNRPPMRIIGKGGCVDLQEIKILISNLKNKYASTIVVGDSYGAYLASLLFFNANLEKIIVMSGFISITYQFLFSTERLLLKKVLSANATDFLNMVQHSITNQVPISFYQGTDDTICPIKQFDLIKNTRRIRLYKLKHYTHRESGEKFFLIGRKILMEILDL